jgi:hypothetical protein
MCRTPNGTVGPVRNKRPNLDPNLAFSPVPFGFKPWFGTELDHHYLLSYRDYLECDYPIPWLDGMQLAIRCESPDTFATRLLRIDIAFTAKRSARFLLRIGALQR